MDDEPGKLKARDDLEAELRAVESALTLTALRSRSKGVCRKLNDDPFLKHRAIAVRQSGATRMTFRDACGLAVGNPHFNLPQQGHDLLGLIPLDGHDQLPSSVDSLIPRAQKAPVTSSSSVISRPYLCAKVRSNSRILPRTVHTSSDMAAVTLGVDLHNLPQRSFRATYVENVCGA